MALGDYEKTTYVNGGPPGISAERLNNNENKTAELDQAVNKHLAETTQAHGGIVASSEVVTAPAANKILKLNGNSEFPISILGSNAVKNNFAATVDPTVNDDVNSGYSVGGIWVNYQTDNKKVYMCVDNTATQANWELLKSQINTFFEEHFADFSNWTTVAGNPTAGLVNNKLRMYCNNDVASHAKSNGTINVSDQFTIEFVLECVDANNGAGTNPQIQLRFTDGSVYFRFVYNDNPSGDYKLTFNAPGGTQQRNDFDLNDTDTRNVKITADFDTGVSKLYFNGVEWGSVSLSSTVRDFYFDVYCYNSDWYIDDITVKRGIL